MLRVVPLLLVASVAFADDIAVYAHPAMGTEFEVRIGESSEDAEVLATEAFDVIDALEDEISSWKPTSYTTYVNHHAAEQSVRVSPDVLELFARSKHLSEITFGAFDPTVGPLLDVWKIRSGGEAPDESSVAEARARVGMQHVHIDDSALTISYDRDGVWVDWGAVGKGYALDLVAKRLRDRGVTSALLSAGTSTIVAIGSPPGATGWTVKFPAGDRVSDMLPVLLRDAALSTSVCHENAAQPCDILDPRVGRPVSVAASATVIADSGLDADALSTALLVMTREEAERFSNEHPAYRVIRFVHGNPPETYNWKQ